MNIDGAETKIKEEWLFDNGKMISDDVGKRIDWLLNNHLKKIATDYSGWEKLYQDPDDKRYWELTYPHGEMQGGGPRLLVTISVEQAAEKYKF